MPQSRNSCHPHLPQPHHAPTATTFRWFCSLRDTPEAQLDCQNTRRGRTERLLWPPSSLAPFVHLHKPECSIITPTEESIHIPPDSVYAAIPGIFGTLMLTADITFTLTSRLCSCFLFLFYLRAPNLSPCLCKKTSIILSLSSFFFVYKPGFFRVLISLLIFSLPSSPS